MTPHERARPDEGAGSESWWEPDEASLHPACDVLAWPDHEVQGDPPEPIAVIDRRRHYHLELRFLLRDAA